MTTAELAAWRLHHVGLAGPAWPSIREVVRRLGAMQSQDFGPAIWSVAQRLGGVGETDLLAEFDAGHILRTHVLRPTWHFVLPEDIGWLLDLKRPSPEVSP